MRKSQRIRPDFQAKSISPDELETLLLKGGKVFKGLREGRISKERFALEIKISDTQVTKYEAGGDMLFTTFLRLLRGLDTTGEAFFKALKK